MAQGLLLSYQLPADKPVRASRAVSRQLAVGTIELCFKALYIKRCLRYLGL